MNRDEVLARLEPERGFEIRPVGERPVVLVEEGGDAGKITAVSIRPDRGAHAIEMSAAGIESMLKRIGLSEQLTKKLQPGTLAIVCGEALSRTQVAVMVKDHRAIDIVSAKGIRLIQPERVISTIEKAIPGAEFHRVMSLPNHVVRLETIGTEEKPVSRGDLVRAGVLTQFSVLGATLPTIQTFVVRLACTNGATTMDVFSEFAFSGGGHGEDGGDFQHWLKLKSRAAYRSLDKVVNRWIELTHEVVAPADRADLLAHWIKESRVPPEIVPAIQALALNEPPQNQYDMMNLITYATSHFNMEPVAISRTLDRVAGIQSQEHHRKLCPTCNRAR